MTAQRETASKLNLPAGISLGRAIRALRTDKGLSLSQLALAASIDKGYLSRVERGLKVPSVAILLRISTVLEVSAAQLFGAAEDQEMLFVTRADERGDLIVNDGSYHMRLLTRSDSSSGLEAFLMYPSLTFHDEPESEHRGEELLFVVEGQVEIKFPDKNLILNTGDSAQFPGPLRHQVRGLTENSCVLITVSGT